MNEDTPDAKQTFMMIAAAVFTGTFNHWQYRRIWSCIGYAIEAAVDLARECFLCLMRFAALLAFPISIPALFFLARFLQLQARKHIKYDDE